MQRFVKFRLSVIQMSPRTLARMAGQTAKSVFHRCVMARELFVVLDGIPHGPFFLRPSGTGPDVRMATGDQRIANRAVTNIRAAGHLSRSLVHLVSPRTIGGTTGEQRYRH
jgi:hypothetical protein